MKVDINCIEWNANPDGSIFFSTPQLIIRDAPAPAQNSALLSERTGLLNSSLKRAELREQFLRSE